MKLSVKNIFISVVLCSAFSQTINAAEFQCSIKDVLRLSEAGSFVTHGWSPNYQNREFTVDRATGKVTGTTALKVRLSNFNQKYTPQLLTSGKKGDSYKAITLYENTGQAAMLLINDAEAGAPKPFFYHTSIGMILTGTCTERS